MGETLNNPFNNTNPSNENSSSGKPKKNKKPAKFNEQKKMAEMILESENRSYFEWLHERHMELVQEKLPEILPTLLLKGGEK
ncbi:hypothetical protein NSQ59_27620 [Margalitia sp. FSL K6-0131]|uniref:hypothetical protein n=1 Tax=Margalitia sp. FSL K6-0131 TaxID=2954604 RepID=UPI0030F7E861